MPLVPEAAWLILAVLSLHRNTVVTVTATAHEIVGRGHTATQTLG